MRGVPVSDSRKDGGDGWAMPGRKMVMREHAHNPSITVIMETVGGHQDKIADAIRGHNYGTA
jgi:hypothetical protein